MSIFKEFRIFKKDIKKTETESERYYESRGRLYIDSKEMTAFHPESNTLETIDYFSRHPLANQPISEKHYKESIAWWEHFTPCKCKFGEGFDIENGRVHDPVVYFNQTWGHTYNMKELICGVYEISDKEENVHSFPINKMYHMRACLQCETCLDESGELVEMLSEELEKAKLTFTRSKKVKELCEWYKEKL